tara:strand:- start:3298 stop:4377 length:1080 start_codon:yes stop_codon:yes gene_type:complete
MTSRKLLERLRKTNKLEKTSSVGTVMNAVDVDAPFVSTTVVNSQTGIPSNSIALTSTYDVATTPIDLTSQYIVFTDDQLGVSPGEAISGNYSSSVSRYITFDAGVGNTIFLFPFSFYTEHTGPTLGTLWDRLGITASNTLADLSLASTNLNNVVAPTLSQHLIQSTSTDPSIWWNNVRTTTVIGDGTGGWLFPSNGAGLPWVGQYYHPILTRYVRIWFASDGTVTYPGWDFIITNGQYDPGPTIVYPIPSPYVDIYYLYDNPDLLSLKLNHISYISFFGKTMSTSSDDPLYIGEGLVLRLEVNLFDEWFAHPTHHVLSVNSGGGIVIPTLPNFGFSDLRVRVTNITETPCRISLFFRYS